MTVLLALPTIAADTTDGSENPYKQSRRGYRIIVDGGTFLSLTKETDFGKEITNIFEDDSWLFPSSGSGLWELRFSNGYQFNNYFYLGGGIAMNHFPDDKLWAMPIFAHVRINFLNGRISPFVDGKIGVSITSEPPGTYIGGMVGVRIGMTRTTAINVSIDLRGSFTTGTPSHPNLCHSNMGLIVGYEF